MTTRASIRLVVAIVTIALASASVSANTFGTSGRRFVWNGTPRFMVFVSYFGAIRHRIYKYPQYTSSLNYLKQKGVKGIRVFPNWWSEIRPFGNNPRCIPAGENLMSASHAATDYVRLDMLDQLKALIVEADGNDLAVDVSFAMEPVSGLTFSQYKKALERVTTGLKNIAPNVFFDLQNEANLPAADCNKVALQLAQFQELRDAVKTKDGARLVTVSLDQNVTGNVAGAAGSSPYNYDITAYHDPRGYPIPASYPVVPACASLDGTTAPAWVRCTCSRVGDVAVGIPSTWPNTKPVYLQEPERSNTVAANPGAFFQNSLLEAAVRAKLSGAAAWTLHTEVSFLVPGFGADPVGFFNNGFPSGLTSVETDFLNRLTAVVDTFGEWNAGFANQCSAIVP